MKRNKIFFPGVKLGLALLQTTSLCWFLTLPSTSMASSVASGRTLETNLYYHNVFSSLQPGAQSAGVQPKAQNELGFDQNEAYVSDLKSYWSYSSLHYYRLLDCGKWGGRLNYAHRFGTTGKQYQLEAIPKFSKIISAYLSYSYANRTQILFPNDQYLVEGYFTLPKAYELSLGQGGAKYLNFGNKNIFSYSLSLGKYSGNNYFWFKPRHYTPVNVEYYELGYRRYFSDSDNYLTLRGGLGKLPDIGDLPPLDQLIVVNQKWLSVDGQMVFKKVFLLRLGLGYTKQLFPSGLVRRITDGSVGLAYKF